MMKTDSKTNQNHCVDKYIMVQDWSFVQLYIVTIVGKCAEVHYFGQYFGVL